LAPTTLTSCGAINRRSVDFASRPADGGAVGPAASLERLLDGDEVAHALADYE
jgi:hypothetical protein